MTFEEALASALEAKKKWGSGSSEAWLINSMVALGVLNLDEPKTPNHAERIDQAIKEMGWSDVSAPILRFCGLNIEQALRHAGLKIVEAHSRLPQETAP